MVLDRKILGGLEFFVVDGMVVVIIMNRLEVSKLFRVVI